MEGEPIQTPGGPESAWVRPEELLARIGLRQHRLVTTAQLTAVSWGSSVIGDRVRQGRLHPVFTGVFSLGGPPRTERELWMASVLTFGEGTRLSDAPAAAGKSTAWGYIDHIPVTSPEQTILDCARTIRSDKLFKRIIRQAQADKSTSHPKLLAFTSKSAGVRESHGYELSWPTALPTRSANEDEVLDLLRSNPLILSNHDIAGDEVDLYLPEHGVVIEIDGPPHDSPAAKKHDAAKQRRLERRGLKVYRLT